MKVYLAACFKQKDEIVAKAEDLAKIGIECTSRWRFETDTPTCDLSDKSGALFFGSRAIEDLDDIDNSDILILINGQKSGGKNVETGYALAKNKPIYLVGPCENVFHWIPDIEKIESWDKMLEMLKNKLV